MPSSSISLINIVSYDLYHNTIETLTSLIEKGESVPKALNKSVDYVIIKSNNKNRSKIKKAIVNTIIERPEKLTNEGDHDYAGRIGVWKRANRIIGTRIDDLKTQSFPFCQRVILKYNFKNYLSKNTDAAIIMFFITWGFIHILFSRNETYSIYYDGTTYLKNASESIYNSFVYKLRGNYSNYIVSGTVKSYFGIFPEWFGNLIILGYYVIAIYGVYIKTNKKEV